MHCTGVTAGTHADFCTALLVTDGVGAIEMASLCCIVV